MRTLLPVLLCVPVLAQSSSPIGYRGGSLGEEARALRIWYPAVEEGPLDAPRPAAEAVPVAPGRHPLLLFSHGLWSVPEASSFLAEELARAGFIVAGVHHADAASGWAERPPELPAFLEPGAWTAETHRDRAEDLVALLDALLAEDRVRGAHLFRHVEREAVGALGHSLGGYTVYGLVGGWPEWREPRIRAALLLSPYTLPFLDGRGGEVTVPVQLQGATLDLGITPFLPALYAQLAGPKQLLVLAGENHFSWTNLVCRGRTGAEAVAEGAPALITRFARSFFAAHLKEDAAAEALLRRGDPALHSYRCD